MNNYHIYDQIGRGKHSVVYKGRKKRSVEYVAIKSTDRDQKGRVLQEVKVMHAIKHPNILRFHAWYETTKHLWLILEYCVGGDLRSLLRTDRQLPEATILRFARDLAAALQYLHSRGTLHCDLAPANLLLDENGRVKLGGFSLSRRVGDAAANAPLSASQSAGGGASYYTAPELLRGTAPPSAASDLWSLGCILYECASGRPPFVASSVASLTSLVQTSKPAPLIGNSSEFQDLVSRLLDPDPATRLRWPELCSHPFWGASPLEQLNLPPEVAAPRAPQVAPQAGHNANGEEVLAAQQSTDSLPSDDVSPLRVQAPHHGTDDGLQDEEQGTGLEAGATPLHPSSRQRAPEQAQQQAQQPDAKDPAPGSLEALIWHPTDTTMKPIVGNRRIQRPMETAYGPSLLPFKPLSPQEVAATPPPARLAFLQSLQRLLAGSAHQHTKLAVLAYLESLAVDMATSHELINSDLCIFMVRMLHNSVNSALRARLANLVGLLVRHTSIIQDSLAAAGLVEVLATGMTDTDIEVQRRCTAALGELLFYIASQQRDPRAAAAPGPWQVPGEVLETMVHALGKGGDEIVQHYVAKTIENIVGQAGAWANRFATPQVLELLSTAMSGRGSDPFRGTAASALCRLLRCKPSLVPLLLDQRGMALAAAGLVDSSPRVQQAAVTILCLLLSKPSCVQRAQQAAAAEPELLPSLCVILEHPVDVLRAKGLVAVALLCHGRPAALDELCVAGVLQRVEKCGREQSAYVSDAMAALRHKVAALVPALLGQVEAGVQELQQKGTAGDSSQSTEQSSLPQMTTLLCLLGSTTLRDVVVSSALVASLADLLTQVVGGSAAWPGSQQVKEDVLQAIDGICCHPELLVRHHQAVLTQLLPALSAAVATSNDSSDTRFLCLKLLCDIVLQSVTEPSLYYPLPDTEEQGGAEAAGLGTDNELIGAAVARYVLPLAPALFADEDPMPLYALKMLGILLDVNPAWVSALASLGMARRFFEQLSIEHPHNNVHNIRLCRLVAQSGVLLPAQLLELRVADRVLAVLSYAHEAGVDPFLEPSLELCMVLLEVFSRQATGAEETSKFLPALPLLLELCAHSDPSVAAAAAACLAGVAQLHPEDAAAILAADNGFALMAGVLQPRDGGAPNEAAAYHLLHALVVAGEQPAFMRRRDGLEELAAVARRLMHATHNAGLKQAAADALSVLGARRLGYA